MLLGDSDGFRGREDIIRAKKILYEGDAPSKSTLIHLLVVMGFLAFMFILTVGGISDQWDCTVDTVEAKHNYVCKELKKAVNCQTLQGPISATVRLIINEEVQSEAQIICPWEIAVSELRTCFCLLSIVCVFVGIYAVLGNSKKYADLYINGSIFFGILLLISSYFDYASIQNSQLSNQTFCTFQDQFQLQRNIRNDNSSCSFSFYYVTVFESLFAGLVLLYSSTKVKEWKLQLHVETEL